MNGRALTFIPLMLLSVGCLSGQRASAAGMPQHIVCPSLLSPSQVTVKAADGWTALYLPGMSLPPVDARAWWGRLEDHGVMIGETEKRKDGSYVTHFSLAEAQPDLPLVEKWMVCDYGNDLYQALRLPEETRECSVAFKRNGKDVATGKPRYVIARIECH